jgi:hypothetical protein
LGLGIVSNIGGLRHLKAGPTNRAATMTTFALRRRAKRATGTVPSSTASSSTTAGLTPQFAAIESFDVSADRGEVVFSAKRKDSFDIGLVALKATTSIGFGGSGGWCSGMGAARQQVAFIVHGKAGDIVRTVRSDRDAAQRSFPRQRSRDRVGCPGRTLLPRPQAPKPRAHQSVKYDGGSPRTEVPPQVSSTWRAGRSVARWCSVPLPSSTARKSAGGLDLSIVVE